ncbi:thioredoxin-disulfide reductase [Candidatus Micrarchaeota archaeon CG_4_10_14_0_2_um_filter_60_11]|nr:MAG: hypothetical protein AUJ16_03910 [Candidatus Micrarchaeota archaeon CG1_02_60_51]PIN96189.1 MAG: thioredoxin-disulfide reductase [Candidatus Micrarchaeota archaeon CG10_big_fil_rev_8_21_14_0_10_60_32]PIO01901.1 MAG: thioredoxin-disulfide reductase [Candidatus Micrarchaeota archaeon CG09_land_8_20_14_0_10_60_16]PIZ91036.1 MAG: thioredoxin-disulfide reductase [Candidatus Micrarchaeota archaeon CG_4_10_14_0_2_um_filter_60_11]
MASDCDLLVIGSGPAGLTAAVYARRRGLGVTVLEGGTEGGYLANAPNVENYPGFKAVSGLELAGRMLEQAKAAGAEVARCEVSKIEKAEGGGFAAVGMDGSRFTGKTLLLATGAEHRKLGAKSEAEYAGKGVSYCATCDAPLFAGKPVAVIGGGSAAFATALMLVDLKCRVFLIHRSKDFRAENALVEKAKAKGVELVVDTVVTEIKGDRFVNSVAVTNVLTKQAREIPVNGVFIAVGIKPMSELAAALGVETDAAGFVKVDLKTCATSVPGVFAAGDVTGWFKQIVAATAQGALAATSAADYLKNKPQA